MTEHYILKGKVPIPCENVIEWALWFETADRMVAKTTIGEADVSTVFLSLDHAFGGGLPVLFETMIFGGHFDGEQWRYHTWEEAEEGHKRAVELVSRQSKLSMPVVRSTRKMRYLRLGGRKRGQKD